MNHDGALNRIAAMRAKRAKAGPARDLAHQIHAAGRQNRRPARPLPEGVWRKPVAEVAVEHERRCAELGLLSRKDGLGCYVCGDRPLEGDLEGDDLLWAQSFLRCEACGDNYCVLCRVRSPCDRGICQTLPRQ